jgi:uncharacterized membrane protein YqgA involved in biofilm formation
LIGPLIRARFSEKANATVVYALGAATLLIVFRIARKTDNILLIIVCVGMYFLAIKKIKVGNSLPALVVAGGDFSPSFK